MHIFWQKRIVEGDAETRWWYPFQTNSGAIRQDRIVFPIPPGTHWSEVTAVAVPCEHQPALEAPKAKAPRGAKAKPVRAEARPPVGLLSGFRFAADEKAQAPKAAKVRPPKPPPAKIDPKFLTAARELRDRRMERVNDAADTSLLASAGSTT